MLESDSVLISRIPGDFPLYFSSVMIFPFLDLCHYTQLSLRGPAHVNLPLLRSILLSPPYSMFITFLS